MRNRFYTLLAVVMIATSTLAWNNVGHRIVADIAYQCLTPQARQHVDQTLGFRRAMVAMSSWPDEIKSDTIYPESHVWHFQDIEAGKSIEDIKYLYEHKLSEGKHLFAAKDSLITLLRQQPDNVDALKFLIHFGGDEFQPMHMGHIADVAGNRIQMTWFGQRMNLHSLWDRFLIDYTAYSSTEYADYLMCKYEPQMQEYVVMTELEAICHTYDAATAIYDYNDLLDGLRNSDGSMPRGYEYKYAYNFLDTMEEQLFIAGIQLANVLNDLFK